MVANSLFGCYFSVARDEDRELEIVVIVFLPVAKVLLLAQVLLAPCNVGDLGISAFSNVAIGYLWLEHQLNAPFCPAKPENI